MRESKQSDLRWIWSGDLALSSNGDLKDTSEHELMSFIQEVQTRLRSDLYDWVVHPHIGTSLSDLIGEPNNKETAEEGKAKIISALAKDAFVDVARIRVRYMPVGRDKLLYSVLISLPESTDDEILNISLLMDTAEFSIVFI